MFRLEALKIANHECQDCGNIDFLFVTHVLPRKDYPELSYNLENVRVLCEMCRKEKQFFDRVGVNTSFYARNTDIVLASCGQSKSI